MRDLSVRYGRTAAPVVDGITFDILPGECVGLVGESGSGKSVTARALIGLAGPGSVVSATSLRWFPPSSAAALRGNAGSPAETAARGSASARADGVDLAALGPAAFRRMRGRDIGYIPQAALVGLDPLRTVGREIADALRLHARLSAAERAARVVELLAEAGVPEPQLRATQRAGELSGGLRQRALIASAIALRPALLIADEPTTALDSTVQAGILNLLDELRSTGTAVLLISHDLAVVSRLANRVAVMQAGRIVEFGATRSVLDAPQHPYTQRLVSAVPTSQPRHQRLLASRDEPAPASASASTPSAAASGLAAGTAEATPTPTPTPATALYSADVASTPSAAPAVLDRTPLLQAHHLVRRFGDRIAVDDVSFELQRGRTLGVVGESGSGKTTVARLVLALDRPDSGDVLLHGRPWSAVPERERRGRRPTMGAIYQDALSSFDPRPTVGQILSDALTGGRSSRTDVTDLLDMVGLDARTAAQRPRFLSGGQQQRVAIARALAPRPQILICDEPVSSLDVSVQAQVLDLLDDLQHSLGLSYLFITHDLGVVRHMSDEVLVMRDGRVLEQGATEMVFEHPSHDYTRALLAAAPQIG